MTVVHFISFFVHFVNMFYVKMIMCFILNPCIYFRSLETSVYSANTFTDILNKIQKSVDDLSLNAYSNLHAWVAKLDEGVEQKLAGRLEAGIKAWTKVLEGKSNSFLVLNFCISPY